LTGGPALVPLAFTLDPAEGRVLGVLIEKDLTTPDQYPLSLNSLTNGCNQKSNRSPITALSKDEVMEAILRLRVAQLIEFVRLDGSRVEHYGHRALSTLGLSGRPLAVFTELLLRGPQSAGDLRARAARMAPIPTREDLEGALAPLIERGLVVQRPAPPGSRAPQYEQLLCPGTEPAPAAAAGSMPMAPDTQASPAASPARVATTPTPEADLTARVEQLEAMVARLTEAVERLGG
jgi:uncharacterized protein YceH (UPF0502 family)